MRSRSLGRSSHLETADWTEAAERLGRDGWVRLPKALSKGSCESLIRAAPDVWHALPPEEGVVHQVGTSAYQATIDCARAVTDLASELASRLTDVAALNGWPKPPAFNETTWVRYPRGIGHITAHRDPAAYTGVIGVINLDGEAVFRIFGFATFEWTTATGDIVLFAGRGWPNQDSPWPRHEAGAPSNGDRTIMTLRHNSQGAGEGYQV